jgi:hypothetical protein
MLQHWHCEAVALWSAMLMSLLWRMLGKTLSMGDGSV